VRSHPDQRLLEQIGVDPGVDGIRTNRHGDVVADGHGARDTLEQRLDRSSTRLRGFLLRLGPRERQERARQPRQSVGLLLDRREKRVPCGRIILRAGLQHLHRAHDPRHRVRS
jgi:hypothetical protein